MPKGYFGNFGGQYVPELLMPPLLELEEALQQIVLTPPFEQELQALLSEYVGRPTPLTLCRNLSRELGFELWLKREDLAHTGAHKINNTLGQALLAQKMGKTALVAETGAGQHGVATATAAALLGLDCLVYMGAKDILRQAMNVRRMNLLGARVVAVESGTQTLKDAINAALRHWIGHQADTHYCLGSVTGPHPFPELVRRLQTVIGVEIREQFQARRQCLPREIMACVGGGSNAIGAFFAFIEDSNVKLTGVEAAGSGKPGCCHSATLTQGTPGVLHGAKTLLLQDADGQISHSDSIAAGLDYPGVGPEHVHLQSSGRAQYVAIHDAEALAAFKHLCRSEGIIPALESSHALAAALRLRGQVAADYTVVVNLSGRGDKDLDIIDEHSQLQRSRP